MTSLHNECDNYQLTLNWEHDGVKLLLIKILSNVYIF